MGTGSERLHVHITMMNEGHDVNESDTLHLSIPLCHDESLRTDGNKNILTDTKKCIYDRKMTPQWIGVETLLLKHTQGTRWRDTF